MDEGRGRNRGGMKRLWLLLCLVLLLAGCAAGRAVGRVGRTLRPSNVVRTVEICREGPSALKFLGAWKNRFARFLRPGFSRLFGR